MRPLEECRLYTFVDSAYLRGRSPSLVARLLCDGGSDLIQLRAKGASADQVRRWADEILPIVDRAGAGLVINDHPDIAVASGAPFCHLGQEDFFDAGYSHVAQIKMLANRPESRSGPLQVGLSTHAPPQAQRAVDAGADYVAIGPVFATGTKPDAKPVTLEYVHWASRHLHVPWFAIGGINLETLEAVLEAGAKRICVVSAILLAPDLVRTCQAFRERLLSAGHGPGSKP